MGRKPDPTALKRLKGNPGKRRLNDREPQPPMLAPGDVPEELSNNPVAQREWLRVVPMLRTNKMITEADRSAMVAYCLEWSRYITAQTVSHAKLQHPARAALAHCLKLWQEFGMTPSSRSRVHMAESVAPNGDEFSEFDKVSGPAYDTRATN